MPTCAIYCRVSTAGQTSNDPWASLPRQAADLQALAARLGLAVALEEVEQASGAKADRPGWARVLEAARTGVVSAILVVSFDRATRSERLADWEALKVELRAAHVRLITIKQGEIDLSGSADAETRSDFDAVLSKRERLVIRERTMAGRRKKAEAGGYTGKHPPLGYRSRFDEATGARRFEEDPERAPIVRRIFALYAAGQRPSQIGRQLMAEGVPPPPARRPGDGRFWYQQTIREILAHPEYVGLAGRLGGPLVASTAFPALVERDVWDEVQIGIGASRQHHPRGAFKGYPLASMLRCNTCGGGMVHRARPDGRADYVCWHDKQRANPCPAKQLLNKSTAEETVLAYLAERLPAYVEGAVPRPRRAPRGPDPARLERALAEVRQRQSRLLDWILGQPTPPPEGDVKMGELREEAARLERELADARQAQPATIAPRSLPRSLVAAIPLLAQKATTQEEKRRLFEAAIMEVQIVKTSPHGARPQKLAVARLVLKNGVVL